MTAAWGKAERIAVSGVTVERARTVELPPPVVTAEVLASTPITAIDAVEAARGRTPPESLSRTAPCSAARVASAAWAGVAGLVARLMARGCVTNP